MLENDEFKINMIKDDMMRRLRKVASDVDESVLLKKKGKLAFMKRKRRLTIMLLMELHQKS